MKKKNKVRNDPQADIKRIKRKGAISTKEAIEFLRKHSAFRGTVTINDQET